MVQNDYLVDLIVLIVEHTIYPDVSKLFDQPHCSHRCDAIDPGPIAH